MLYIHTSGVPVSIIDLCYVLFHSYTYAVYSIFYSAGASLRFLSDQAPAFSLGGPALLISPSRGCFSGNRRRAWAELYGRISLYVAARPLQARLLAHGSSPGSAALRPVVTRLPPWFGSSASGGVWGSPFALPRFGRSASGGVAGCKAVVARAFQRF